MAAGTTPATPNGDGGDFTRVEFPTLPIDEIIVGARKCARDVSGLIESISDVGLLNPISVNERKELIAGRHRLEACKQLGWRTIPVRLIVASDLVTELASIDENLIRNTMTHLERGEALKRRKEIYEALHPETIHGVAGALGTHRKLGRGDATASTAVASFVEDTSKKTGRSVRAIREDLQIAKGLCNETKSVISGTPLEASKPSLLALAREKDPAKQLDLSKSVASGRTGSVAAAAAEAKIHSERAAKKPRPETKKQTESADLDERIHELLTVDCMTTKEAARALNLPAWRIQYAKKRLGLVRSDDNPLRRIIEHSDEFSDALNDAATIAESSWGVATAEQVATAVASLNALKSVVVQTIQRLKKEAGKGNAT